MARYGTRPDVAHRVATVYALVNRNTRLYLIFVQSATSVSYTLSLHDALPISAARNVTGRKKAEEKFRSLLEAAPDAIVIVDGQSTRLNSSHKTKTFFVYSCNELINQPVEILVPQRFRGAHPAHRTAFFGKPAA